MKKFSLTYCLINSLVLGLVAAASVQTVFASGAACSLGISEPPFLSYGVKSNLLLLLDNSGSMLDLAYVDDTGADQCYDDSYDDTKAYAGYFEQDSWYSYDFTTDERFEVQSGRPSSCDSATYTASNADGDEYVCVTGGTVSVTQFAATGKFMNWAAASKFDIQKKILTGGKYDSVNDNLQMETRGCSGKRFVKQITVLDSSDTAFKMALGVRGPREQFELWYAKGDYVAGDIVAYEDLLYKAKNDITGNPTNNSPDVDTTNWLEYWGSRWKAGQAYSVNTAVYSMETDEWYWTASGGTATSTAADITEDTGVTWVPYDGTQIEIFKITTDGFETDACQQVIDLLSSLDGSTTDGSTDDGNTPLGQIKALTEDCMGFTPGGDTLDRARKSSFNLAMQECWYYDKFGHWQPGDGTVNSLKNSCENVYDYLDPNLITPWDSSYVCYGVYQGQFDIPPLAADKYDYVPVGYVGRCWEVSTTGTNCTETACSPSDHADNFWTDAYGEQYTCYDSKVYECATHNCTSSNLVDKKPADWTISLTCTGAGGGTLNNEWTDDNFYYFDPCPYNSCADNNAIMADYPQSADANWDCTTDGVSNIKECHTVDATADRCVDQALKDFCNIYNVAEVIDPSDATTSTGEIWNMPAFLVDGGVQGQLDLPIAVMRGYIYQSAAPEGILQSTASDLRIGAMAFNAVGAKYECDNITDSPAIEKYCPDDPDQNKDGARVISNIQLGSEEVDAATNRTHIEDVVTAINNTRATSWTPLAEAVYNAIGYYTQNDAMRLNSEDFTVTASGYTNNTDYNPGAVVSDGGQLYQTVSGGHSSGVTPATDTGVVWSTIDALDPVTNWCQENHLLIITEGASTADIKDTVATFVTTTIADKGYSDTTSTDGVCIAGTCEDGACTDGLEGSTYLDDLTTFAHDATAADLYPTGQSQLTVDGETHDKANITTHIVVTGTVRDTGDTDECNPKVIMEDAATGGGTTLIQSSSPEQLENDLLAVFNELRQRASAGSAASVISSARGGEGAIYQAIFWPQKKRTHQDGTEYTVEWAGDVHALFIDTHGYLYEDTDGDRQMDTSADKRVIVYFDEDTMTTKACLDTSILTNVDKTCDSPVDLDDVKFLWSASQWLNDTTMDADIEKNRSTYLSNEKRRYIYTWNDLNNDGIVDTSTEWLPFVASTEGTNWAGLAVSGGRGSVAMDFDVDYSADNTVTNLEVNDVVNWIRGEDRLSPEDNNSDGDYVDAGDFDYALRSRQLPTEENGTIVQTQRLGDVIHSTPMTISSPAEGYHLIYNDDSYADFYAKWKQRRHMIYFGGNDGMLHAINGGFYVEAEKKFCLSDQVDADGNCDESTPPANGYPALGQEMWAYVPYNLLPHLKCLTQESYGESHYHKYYVDLRPRIFDAQIFEPDTAHPHGWGTILVGGMRFGGVPVDAEDLDGADVDGIDDPRQFISAYFVFDVTDPENPPVLLGEMTRYGTGEQDLNGNGVLDAGEDLDNDSKIDWHTDLGQSSVISTMVIMKKNNIEANKTENQWYLILGSGPHGPDAMKGVSDQTARLAVVPLDWLVSTTNSATRTAMRIPGAPPSASNHGGTIVLSDAANGFTGDLVTIDGDINPSREDYMADAVYFGTVEGDFDPSDTYWDGGGRLYRLMTRNTPCYGSAISQGISTPDQWSMSTFLNAGKPISAAPSVGFDGYNFWVYVGTGRFFDAADKTDDSQQSYYGIKEPMETTTCDDDNDINTPEVAAEKFLGGEVTAPPDHGAAAVSSRTWPTGATASKPAPGTKGLLKVDEIWVKKATTASTAELGCRDGGTDCLPSKDDGSTVDNLEDLILYIAGQDDSTDTSDNWHNAADGWFIDFYPYGNRERNVGQATLLGGLVTFSTYQPYDDPCKAEGKAYLYGVHYQTGTAWYEAIFGDSAVYTGDYVMEKLDIGRGLATTPNLHVTGDGDQVTAFLQTSTGEIREISQQNLPIKNFFSGRSMWRECTN